MMLVLKDAFAKLGKVYKDLRMRVKTTQSSVKYEHINLYTHFTIFITEPHNPLLKQIHQYTSPLQETGKCLSQFQNLSNFHLQIELFPLHLAHYTGHTDSARSSPPLFLFLPFLDRLYFLVFPLFPSTASYKRTITEQLEVTQGREGKRPFSSTLFFGPKAAFLPCSPLPFFGSDQKAALVRVQ